MANTNYFVFVFNYFFDLFGSFKNYPDLCGCNSGY